MTLTPSETTEHTIHSLEENLAYLQKFVEASGKRSDERCKMLRNITANLIALKESLEEEHLEIEADCV